MDKLANARTKEFRKRHRETSSDSKANPKGEQTHNFNQSRSKKQIHPRNHKPNVPNSRQLSCERSRTKAIRSPYVRMRRKPHAPPTIQQIENKCFFQSNRLKKRTNFRAHKRNYQQSADNPHCTQGMELASKRRIRPPKTECKLKRSTKIPKNNLS